MISIRSGLKNKVLNYFFINEHTSLYINELARILDADPKNLYRTLTQLEGERLLKSEFKGKQRYFSCNTAEPIYKNFKAVFLKTSGLEQTLKQRLSSLKDISAIYIFGSYASGRINAESDIDILFVGDHNIIEAEKVLYDISREIGRAINAIHLTPTAFNEKKKHNDPFLFGIFEQKTIKVL